MQNVSLNSVVLPGQNANRTRTCHLLPPWETLIEPLFGHCPHSCSWFSLSISLLMSLFVSSLSCHESPRIATKPKFYYFARSTIFFSYIARFINIRIANTNLNLQVTTKHTEASDTISIT
ncbi:hypothetical protein Hanom_Chr16g01479041 [Helianthus anomalus]